MASHTDYGLMPVIAYSWADETEKSGCLQKTPSFQIETETDGLQPVSINL